MTLYDSGRRIFYICVYVICACMLYIYIYLYVCVYVYVHVYVYVCTYIHVYTYVHINTYIIWIYDDICITMILGVYENGGYTQYMATLIEQTDDANTLIIITSNLGVHKNMICSKKPMIFPSNIRVPTECQVLHLTSGSSVKASMALPGAHL